MSTKSDTRICLKGTKYQYKVSQCVRCNHITPWQSGNFCTKVVDENKYNKSIEHISTIPDWCPLPKK